MALRRIVRFPEPGLRQATTPVTEVTRQVRTLIEDMMETMYSADGAGLAAVQVNAPERIFIIESTVAGLPKEDRPLVFINPVIEHLSPETEIKDEGCLSFPGVFIPIKRALAARVRALDIDGNPFTIEGRELFARAMQHEHDHLVNKLLVDYAGPVKRQLIRRKLERMTDDEARAIVAQH